MMLMGCLRYRVGWNPVTREQGLNPAADIFTVYGAEKTLAEKAAWDFAEKHPHVDITTGAVYP